MSWSWFCELSKEYQSAAPAVSAISFASAFLGIVAEVSAFAVITKRGRIVLAIAIVLVPAIPFALASLLTLALALPTGRIVWMFIPPTMFSFPVLSAFWLIRDELKKVRNGPGRSGP